MSGVRNDDLAYQALDYIREHPEEWDQKNYFCGTTACFAGRVLILTGHPLTYNRYASANPPGTGRSAALALGWTWEDARSVFYNSTSDFSELERLVKNVLNGEVQEADRR